MGFINPFLYGIAVAGKALNDIVDGAALGCQGVDLQNDLEIAGAGVIPFASWNATAGWDPVTGKIIRLTRWNICGLTLSGLGTPNFQKLKALALAI